VPSGTVSKISRRRTHLTVCPAAGPYPSLSVSFAPIRRVSALFIFSARAAGRNLQPTSPDETRNQMSNKDLSRLPAVFVVGALFMTGFAGCSVKSAESAAHAQTAGGGGEGGGQPTLAGQIEADGSSTVYPITQAVAEEFTKINPKVAIRVNISGTGGGFKRFKEGDLDICDASRPVEATERDACIKNKVGFIELPIGIDGITVVVNSKNTWCDTLTVAQLKKLWEKGSTIKTWKEFDPSFPDEKIILYGPDSDSGTFDYFCEAICGKKGNSRTDYTPSSNDNVLIQGVQGNAGALGYFGYAYYVLNKDTLRAVKIAPGTDKAAVAPTDETILTGKYKPLSRPLFLYVNKKSLSRIEVIAFLKFYLDRGPTLVKEVHYIPLPESGYKVSRDRLQIGIDDF
jgi:phosphate transport system substrate-binding protein